MRYGISLRGTLYVEAETEEVAYELAKEKLLDDPEACVELEIEEEFDTTPKTIEDQLREIGMSWSDFM